MYEQDENVKWIVIHYSATPVERDFEAADIDRMHRDRGFRELGYHYFIRKNGKVQTGRDMAEPGRFEMGAHSYGENDASIGICYEGGVTLDEPTLGKDTRTDNQKAAMDKLLAELVERFPKAKIRGHRDMPGAATQCPGFDATDEYSHLTRRKGSAKSKKAA